MKLKDFMTVGQRIRYARKKMGMSQKDLADKLGISYVGVSQWENDKRKPKYETLQRIAHALNTSAMELMGREEADNPCCPNDSESQDEDDFIAHPVPATLADTIDRMIPHLYQLNTSGRMEAVKRVEELAEIPRFRSSIADSGLFEWIKASAEHEGVTWDEAHDMKLRELFEAETDAQDAEESAREWREYEIKQYGMQQIASNQTDVADYAEKPSHKQFEQYEHEARAEADEYYEEILQAKLAEDESSAFGQSGGGGMPA